MGRAKNKFIIIIIIIIMKIKITSNAWYTDEHKSENKNWYENILIAEALRGYIKTQSI